MENLHPDILESLTEYELEDIINALLKLHDPLQVLDLVRTEAYNQVAV